MRNNPELAGLTWAWVAGGLVLRNLPGGIPNSRLKAWAKANSEVYPIFLATVASDASVSRRSRAARVIRH